MSWCPRCDAIRPGDPGDACYECDADLLDSGVLGRSTKTRNQVLELEREPLNIEEPVASIATDGMPTPPSDETESQVRRFPKRRTLIAGGLCLAMVATSSIVYASHRHQTPHRRSAVTNSTPSTSSPTKKPTPPFGSPAQGRLVFVTGDSFVELDLTDGETNTVTVDGGIGGYRISPDGSRGAYIDNHQTLWVMNGIATQQRRAIATGVQAFTWARGETQLPGYANLLVVRTEPDPHGTRTRVEVADATQGTTTNLLYEGPRGISAIFEAGKSIVVQANGSGGDGTYLLEGERLTLVRAGYIPEALSPDGTYVLAIRQGEGGSYGFARITLDDRKVRTIGAGALTPSAATFAPDGTAIVYDASTGPYRVYPATGKAVRLKSLTDEFLGAPILLSNHRWLYVGRGANQITFEIGPQVFEYRFPSPNDVADVQYVAI